MDFTTIEASPRATGKKAARQVRREGNVPCVLYGNNVAAQTFSMTQYGLMQLVRSEETHLVKVELGKDSWECILKEIVYHPVTDLPIHADFQVLQSGEKITLSVPIHFVGTPKGQIEGGVTEHVLNELDISCFPKDIPSHVEIDVAALELGDSIHIADLTIENVEFLGVPNQTIVTVLAPRVQAVDEEGAEELEEGMEAEDDAAEETEESAE